VTERPEASVGARHAIGIGAAYGLLLSTFVLAMPLGNLAPYIALVALVVGLLCGVNRHAAASFARAPFVVLPASAFIFLAIAFVVGAPTAADRLFVLDFVVLLLPLPLALVLSRLRPAIGGAQTLASLALAGAAASVLVGLFDIFVLGKPRANGFENSPIHFANLAVLFGFMALAGLLAPERRVVFLAGPLLGLVAALLAGTRGALLVAAALAALFALFFLARWPGSVRHKLAGLAAAALLAVAALGLGHLAGFTRPYETVVVFAEMATGRAVSDPSAAHRFEFYAAGLRAFVEAPLFGHGWHNQIARSLPYMSPAAQQAFTLENWGYIHNEPLGFAISGGVVGLLAYCLWMAAPLLGHVRLPSDTQSTARLYLVLCLVVGFFVAGMTDVLFMAELPKTVFVVVMCAILVLCRDRPTTAEPDR
jgi:O-antigen ligase